MNNTETAAAHSPLILLVGTADCFERECEEYVTEAGDDDPGVERCSHIREETICVGCSAEPNADGDYEQTVTWSDDHAAAEGVR
jgi:hypothetical protein